MRECVQRVGGQEDKSHPKPAIELTKSHSVVPFVRSLASGILIASIHMHKSSYPLPQTTTTTISRTCSSQFPFPQPSMTNRLQPCLQPPTAPLLAPATSSQEKQIIESAVVLRWLPRGSLDAGTALLDATDDMLARTLTYRTSKNERKSPSSCHHVSPARAQPCTRLGWLLGFLLRRVTIVICVCLCTCQQQKMTSQGGPTVYQEGQVSCPQGSRKASAREMRSHRGILAGVVCLVW